jgi:tetratricopeptide (TPR) repeat protein/transcriptional regulator with XRE-family HTH domain
MMMTPHDVFSFGVLLKAFRTRRRLTQQHLAISIGMHRNAIIRWEQGEFLPATKTIVLELAKQLRLDDGETRQFLEASLTALSPHWSVPFPRNPFFTGREAILSTLHQHLGADQAVALSQSSALHGLGGVGKTQIALEYAYQHALDYRAVFWVSAETEEQIRSSLVRIAEVLHVPEYERKDQQRAIAAVQRWLIIHGQWLLIWDNVEDLALLEHFLPAARSGVILLTTRHQILGTVAWGLDLMSMEPEEGMLLLLRRAKILPPYAAREQVCLLSKQMPAQHAAAAELVTLLGGLPLALDQAGAYVEETQCGLPAYLNLFRTQQPILLRQRGEIIADHPDSVSTTFTLAIAASAERHPAVRDLLRMCALLHPEAIPEAIFWQGAALFGNPLEAVCGDRLEWNRLVGAACSYSLLSRQAEEQTLSLHRLVQAILLDGMMATERNQKNSRLVGALDAAFPDIVPHSELLEWKQAERLLPHALVCLHRAETLESSLPLASLAYKVAQYLRACGRYPDVEPLLRRALHIREQMQGPNHSEVGHILTAFATLSWNQGKFAEAEPLHQRAVQIQECALGPNHLQMAGALNHLALLYWYQGRYREAEPLMQRVLQIHEHSQEPGHPRMAKVLNDLGGLYYEQGKYREAEPLLHQALAMLERALGPAHPQMALPLLNLANLYCEQSKYLEVEALLQRALQIQETALGPTHPEMVHIFHALADLCYHQQRYAEAESRYQQTLQIMESTLGLDHHPGIAYTLNGLANVQRAYGNVVEAEALYQRALSISEQGLGPEHPETATILQDLARLRQQQGRLDEARTLAERALQIRTIRLGADHPRTVTTRILFAQLALSHREDMKEASAEERHPFPSTTEQEADVCPTSHTHASQPVPLMHVAVRGATEHVAYTRQVRMRVVTFTCTVCQRTVTQLHYPSGTIKYCSDTCRTIRVAQVQQTRVARQREKRQAAQRGSQR